MRRGWEMESPSHWSYIGTRRRGLLPGPALLAWLPPQKPGWAGRAALYSPMTVVPFPFKPEPARRSPKTKVQRIQGVDSLGLGHSKEEGSGQQGATAAEQAQSLVTRVCLHGPLSLLGPVDNFSLWECPLLVAPQGVLVPKMWPMMGEHLSDHPWLVVTSEWKGTEGGGKEKALYKVAGSQLLGGGTRGQP